MSAHKEEASFPQMSDDFDKIFLFCAESGPDQNKYPSQESRWDRFCLSEQKMPPDKRESHSPRLQTDA